VSYFIEETIDQDIEEDIFDYFKESDTDDIETAMQELGDDYTEEEIRLVRIKFLSEMGN
jgi:ATP-dependent DNA helicase RecQ